jgi:hypothetical protein
LASHFLLPTLSTVQSLPKLLDCRVALTRLNRAHVKQVIDARALSPQEIEREIENKVPEANKNEMRDIFRGVDGRNVTDEDQIWNPPLSLMLCQYLPRRSRSVS